MTFPLRVRHTIASLAALCAAIALAGCVLASPPPAAASSRQVAIFEEPSAINHPAQTLNELRSLGVSAVRVSVHWSTIAPASASSDFLAAQNVPGSYPAASWAPYDNLIRQAAADHITVDLVLTGYAPLWARSQGAPTTGDYLGSYDPDPTDFGQFVEAVALRYSGQYNPQTGTQDPGNSADLPGVHFWEIWNEANWGPSLAPQQSGGTFVAASRYRDLLDNAWNSLQITGHGRDTIVDTSLSPRGDSNPGATLTTKPLQFLRNLYCVDSHYRRLTGSAATALGCPTSGSTATFRGEHPGLFAASGFGIHPYPFYQPPTQSDSKDPDFVEFSQIPHLEAALDKLQRAYGSPRKLSVYNTEYGYETNPPNRNRVLGNHHFDSPNTAAEYINWAEYLSWKDPRIASTDQYLLADPPPTQGEQIFGYGGFATGLEFYGGRHKPSYAAYKVPLFLPVTNASRKKALEVWGCARPAHTVSGTQRVQVQFRSGSHGRWRTVKTVTLHNSRGYFDVHLRFPGSGSVRLAWHGNYSRTVSIKLH